MQTTAEPGRQPGLNIPDLRGEPETGTPIEHLDVATVLKVSQAVSGEISLEKLVEVLLRTAIEQAGAERALLILPRGSELWIQAEAKTDGDAVTVRLGESPISPAELPESIVRYSARTQEAVILSDALMRNPYSTDKYIREQRPRSVLCMPLAKQNTLVALIYLESSLGPNIFAPAKIAILKVIASAAAISLDNSRLYRELQEREGKIRRLVDANIIGVLISDSESQIIESNDAFLKMVGYTREELVSGRMRWKDMTPAEWEVASEQGVVQVKDTGVCKVFEKEYYRKDGSRVPVLVGAARFEKDSIVAFAIDLTERKRAEEALQLISRDLQESKARLEEAQRIAHVGYWERDIVTSHVTWSDETYRIFGLQPQERPMDLDAIMQMIHPEDREFVSRTQKEALVSGPRYDFEYRLLRPTGELRIVYAEGYVKKDATGRPYQAFGTVQDITDRKHAEEAMKRSEFYLAEGQRLAHMGSWVFNTTGFDYWSPELFRIYGLNPSGKAPTMKEYLEMVHPEDREFVAGTIQKMIAEHRGFDFTKRIVRPNGEIRRIRCVGVPETNKGTFHGTGIDVTEQEQLTEELRRSEFYLAEGQRLSHAGSWSFKPDLTCDYWSRELYEILGFDPKNGIPTIPNYFTRVHPEDRKVVEATIQRMVSLGEGCDLKMRIIRPDGMQRVIRCVGMPVRENGAVTRFVGTLVDITEQEELTQELRRRETYLAEAQRLSHTGSFGWNVVTNKETWSDETYRICGYDLSIKPSFQLFLDRVHTDDIHLWQEAFGRAAEGKEVNFEHRLVMPDGSVKYLHVVAYGAQKDGKFVELVGTVRDITERKRAEDELRNSEQKYRFLVETTPAFIHTALPNGYLDFFNHGWLEYLGLPMTDLLGWRWTTAIHPEDLEELLNKWRASLESGKPLVVESRVRRADGEYRWFLHRKQPQRNEPGEIVKWYGSSIEIEERKIAEGIIRRGEAFLAEGQRLSRTGSWGWNASTGKMTWSQEHYRILGLDPRNTNPSLDLFWERVHPDDRIGLKRAFEFAIKEKRNFEQEFRIFTPDLSVRHLHCVSHVILNQASELVEIIGATMDISERKRAEERAESQREAIRLALNAFIEELDVDRFLGDLIAELNRQLHAKSWELWLFDGAFKELSLHLSSHSVDSRNQGTGHKNIRRTEELTSIWQSRNIARVPQVFELEVQGSILDPQYSELLNAKGVKTLLIVPLALGEQNLGFLELHFQTSTRFTSDDLELVQTLVNHATLALQLNRLTRRAGQLAVTEERNRMAREIHDTLAQAFAGIVLHSEALGTSLGGGKNRNAKSLSCIQKLARSGLDEARRSVQALRPKALEGSTLSEALKQAAKRLNEGGKLSCHFRQRGEEQAFSIEAQNELFRITQEALTNVTKHANATSVWINLTFTAQQAVLTIRDNGVGLTMSASAEPKHGYGLSTMRERAQRIGGNLEIESPKGGGTSIRIRVPQANNGNPMKQI